jgi:hypothetical protein
MSGFSPTSIADERHIADSTTRPSVCLVTPIGDVHHIQLRAFGRNIVLSQSVRIRIAREVFPALTCTEKISYRHR